MKKKQYKVPDKMWNDKRIKPEGKLIYSYIFAKGMNRDYTDLNVGELQQVVTISNEGLKKNLQKLERYKYLLFKEYANGMYMINILD